LTLDLRATQRKKKDDLGLSLFQIFIGDEILPILPKWEKKGSYQHRTG
jgi:hypothetical protein